MDPAQLWSFLAVGYLLTVAIEAPVLLAGLSSRHSFGRRLFAGLWLTACTYPVVVLVLPLCIDPVGRRAAYLLLAETFAPAAECALFWAAFGTRAEWGRPSMYCDLAVIVIANLASFGLGEWLHQAGWFHTVEGRLPSF